METVATLPPIPDGDFELSRFKTSMHDVESSPSQELEYKEKPCVLLIQALALPILRMLRTP